MNYFKANSVKGSSSGTMGSVHGLCDETVNRFFKGTVVSRISGNYSSAEESRLRPTAQFTGKLRDQ
jgi:hypothetical protein